jgi:hypothetical protein
MFPFLASALLPLRRTLTGDYDDYIEPPERESRRPVFPLTLVAPVLSPGPIMASDPTPLSKTLAAMLKVLEKYVKPPLLAPPPPPLPAHTVLLESVIERTVGLGDRVGTEVRGPFSVAALKGMRVEAVVRYEVWGLTPADVGQAIADLVLKLLGDREAIRTDGFLRIALKSTNPSENVFAEDAYRQNVAFEVLFEFPYVDTDDAESLIARIPIAIDSEINESTTVVDEMARWDNELAPALALRGPLSIGRISALAFVAGPNPTGTVTVTRTFDGASGLPASHPTLAAFVATVSGTTPAQNHAEVTFPSLFAFLRAIASFKITEESLSLMQSDGVPPAVLTGLEGIQDQEVGGEDAFVSLLVATIGPADTAAFQTIILKHSATSEPTDLGDWDENDTADKYESRQFLVTPSIELPRVTDRLEIAYQHLQLDQVAVVYLRAASG